MIEVIADSYLFLNDFTVAIIENAITHKLKTIPTKENSSTLILPSLEINIKYQNKNIIEKIILKIESAFIYYFLYCTYSKQKL